MTFKDSGKKAWSKWHKRDPENDRICANCHHRYGMHFGARCPTDDEVRAHQAEHREGRWG